MLTALFDDNTSVTVIIRSQKINLTKGGNLFRNNGPSFAELIRQALTSTRDGYDLLAPKFDLTPFRTPDELLISAVQVAGEVDCALDLCCGTGAAMAALAPHVHTRLCGIDFSEGMLEQAKYNLSEVRTTAEVEYILQDVMEMKFDQEFDLAVCFGALGHILPADESQFLRRIHRALKPGGCFIFITGTKPSPLDPRAVVLRAFNLIMRIRNRLRKPEFIMYYLTFTLPEIEQKLRAEGFDCMVYEDMFEAPYQRARLVAASRRN